MYHNMKANKCFIALVCAICLMFSSCGEDFLYIAPQGSVSKETLTNKEGVDMLITAAYSNLTRTGWGASIFNWVFGGVYGGDANKGTDAGDQPDINQFEVYNVVSTNGYLSEKYDWVYRGNQKIRFALQFMEEIEGLDPDFVKVRQGELYFLRAMFHFEGVKVFGPYLPWVDETNTDVNPKVSNDQDIYPKILADLDKAIAQLPEKPADLGRVYRWAAMTLKAKVLMQEAGFKGQPYPAEATTLLENVLTNGSSAAGIKFALTESFDFNWNCDNDNKSSESIWEIQFSPDGPTNNGNSGMSLCYPYGEGPGGCCGFYQPSYELANSFQVDENGLPFLDNSYRTRQSVSWFEMVEAQEVNWCEKTATQPLNPGDLVFNKDGTPKMVKVFTLFNNENQLVDPRLDFAAGRDQIPFKDWGPVDALTWVRDFENGGIFNPKKHIYHKKHEGTLAHRNLHDGWAPGSSMNMQYLSVRDAKLLLAECYAAAGDLGKAMTQVNDIRKRAGNEANIIVTPAQAAQEAVPADPKKCAPERPAKPAQAEKISANYKVSEYPGSHAAFSDKETCIKAVRMERKLELAMEGERWFDLVRYGGAYMNQEIAAYLTYEGRYINKFANQDALGAEKTTLPLPRGQIEVMGKDESGNDYLQQKGPWVGK